MTKEQAIEASVNEAVKKDPNHYFGKAAAGVAAEAMYEIMGAEKKGMQWVKASERLPEDGQHLHFTIYQKGQRGMLHKKWFKQWGVTYWLDEADLSENLTIADYEECFSDHRRLVREIDVILNGEDGAAKQASLCDLVGQITKLKGDLTAALVGWKVDMGRAREAEKRIPGLEQISNNYRNALEAIIEEELKTSIGAKGKGSLSYLIAKDALSKYPQPEGRSIDQMDF